MKVVQLAQLSPNAETIGALRVALARAERGELRELAMIYIDPRGEEIGVWTGRYKQAETVLACALRWAKKMSDMLYSEGLL